MRAVIQRVKGARILIENRIAVEANAGLLTFVALEKGDGEDHLSKFVHTLVNLRVFSDDRGKLSRSLTEVGGELLLVSNFTVSSELKGGNRPDFSRALPRAIAEPLYQKLIGLARSAYPKVKSGVFGSFMEIIAVHDGPVTLFLEWR